MPQAKSVPERHSRFYQRVRERSFLLLRFTCLASKRKEREHSARDDEEGQVQSTLLEDESSTQFCREALERQCVPDIDGIDHRPAQNQEARAQDGIERSVTLDMQLWCG